METAGFIKRICALTYDSLVVIGIILSLTLALVWLNNGPGESGSLVSYMQLSIIIFSGPLFYSYFWIKNQGQTLGMQAWRIKLVTAENKNITLKDSIKRCFFSIILFPGYLWILIGKDKLSWADILSNTKIINLRKIN